ncbi:hypothetical protein TSAR_006683, partial [Trichomalopsis sarcophagae]
RDELEASRRRRWQRSDSECEFWEDYGVVEFLERGLASPDDSTPEERVEAMRETLAETDMLETEGSVTDFLFHVARTKYGKVYIRVIRTLEDNLIIRAESSLTLSVVKEDSSEQLLLRQAEEACLEKGILESRQRNVDEDCITGSLEQDDDDDPYEYDEDIPRTEAEVHRATGLLQLSLSSSSQSSGTDNVSQPWTCQSCGGGPSTPIFVLSSPGNTPCIIYSHYVLCSPGNTPCIIYSHYVLCEEADFAFSVRNFCTAFSFLLR